MEKILSFFIIITVVSIMSLCNLILKGSKGKKGEITKLFRTLDGNTQSREKKGKLKKGINTMSSKQYIILFIPVGLTTFTFSLIFFRSVISAMIIMMISTVYPYYMMHAKQNKMKQLLNYQLRDALNALLASLKAGSSINNALVRTHEDLERIFLNEKHKPIVNEFRIISYELDMMIPVEEVLENFKLRNDIEDITDFVNVTLMTRRQGGNLNEVIHRVAEIISDRIQIEREINTLVAGKKMEAKVLTILPVILVVLLSMISPEYMSPLYDTLLGRLLMIFASILLAINYFVGKKIIEIEV